MKKERIIYGCWLALLALLVVFYCLGRSRRPLWGAAKTIGILVFVMLDLLWLLRLLTSEKEGVRSALRRLLFSVGATALYIYYCFVLIDFLNRSSYRDAIVAAALLCVTFIFGDRGAREKQIDTPEE